MKVVIDVFGGDNAPKEVVKGCIDALNEKNDLSLVLVGLENEMKQELAKYKYDENRVELVFATQIVTNDDVPTAAIKQKTDSTMVKALDILKERDDVLAMVSAGNTGALLTGGVLKIGRIKGIARPAIAATMPTLIGTETCIIDVGANIDCRPEFMADFAILGVGFAKAMCKFDNPRVALISNGTEDSKGNAQIQETFKLLKEMPINFVGNMEAREALSGDYDVLVCDGFVGNVLIKSIEGSVKLVMKEFKKALLSSMKSKIGALFLKGALKDLKKKMDYNAKGGAPFVGLEKIVLKAHGSSNALSFKASIFNAIQAVDGKMVETIKDLIVKSKTAKNEIAD